MRHHLNPLVFRVAAALAVTFSLLLGTTQAQTTAFTYQGRLTDNSMPLPTNGTYDFQFKLFDAPSDGNQIGSGVLRPNVTVANGVFNVTLDFGAAAFSGANRWLDISVKLAANPNFTPLLPRRPLNAVPYAVQSLNAATATNATTANNFSGALAGDVTGTQSTTAIANNAVTTPKLADNSVTNVKIVDVAGIKVTGALTTATLPGANVTGAVANATNATNATTAVNFSGALVGDVTGTQSATTIANNAVTTPKLADGSVTNAKIVDVAGSKVTGTIPVAGIPAGSGNYIQNQNAAPQASSNFSISGNGTAAGMLSGNIVNVTTQFNLGGNRILGIAPSNTLFVGLSAGAANTSGGSNTFVGTSAGALNSSGGSNTFIGTSAGATNTTGSLNTTLGAGAQVNSGALSNATALGAGARVDCANCLVLGSISTVNGNDTNVGIGTTTPSARLHVRGDLWGESNIFFKEDRPNANGRNWAIRQNNTNEGDFQIGFIDNNTGGFPDFFGTPSDAKLTISKNGNVGIGATTPSSKLSVTATANSAISGVSTDGVGVNGSSENNHGVSGFTNEPFYSGVVGTHPGNGNGVSGVNTGGGNGIKGEATGVGTGVLGSNTNSSGYAGFFQGRVQVTANLIVENGCAGCGSPPSDARLKRGVTKLGYGLNTVMQLRPVSWRWKDESVDARVQLGFIAQEVEQLMPELIGHGKDPAQTLNLNYLGMVPVVVKAIQEQQQQASDQNQQIEQLKHQNTQLLEQNADLKKELKAENAALKKANAALEARLAALEKLLQTVAPGKQ